jgi:hypothetical protein
MGDALGGQPVGQLQQAGGVGGEGTGLGAGVALRGLVADAGDDRLLVDVEAGAVGV